MNFYPENYAAAITIPLTDPTGAESVPTGLTAKLLDGDGAEIVDLGAQTVDSGASQVITVPGAHNTLPVGELRTVRILVVSYTFAAGTFERRFSYGIEAALRLELMKNSFMTYELAEVISADFVNATGWTVADANLRKTALIESFARLTIIPMKYHPLDANGDPDRTVENVILRDEWVVMNAAGYNALPVHFRRALRRAQFIEANELLQGDVLSQKRRAGVLSETIGESSVRLNAGLIDYGVGTETLSALAGYIHFNMKIVRA